MPKTTPQLFALGDIHAHWHQLAGLIHSRYLHADFQPDRDTLVVLGDEVDGGQHAKCSVSQIVVETDGGW